MYRHQNSVHNFIVTNIVQNFLQKYHEAELLQKI